MEKRKREAADVPWPFTIGASLVGVFNIYMAIHIWITGNVPIFLGFMAKGAIRITKALFGPVNGLYWGGVFCMGLGIFFIFMPMYFKYLELKKRKIKSGEDEK